MFSQTKCQQMFPDQSKNLSHVTCYCFYLGTYTGIWSGHIVLLWVWECVLALIWEHVLALIWEHVLALVIPSLSCESSTSAVA